MTSRTGAMVFGGADGLSLILGLILGLAIAHQPSDAVWHTALAGGLAEFGGMALGQYWSDPEKDKVSAAVNGAASAVTVIVSGVPFATMSGTPAVAVSAVIIILFGVAITWLREETGWLALFHTFGLLMLAGALGAVSGLLLHDINVRDAGAVRTG